MGIRKENRIPHEDDLKDGIVYDAYGRMQYHPEFHPNHGKVFSDEELEYLCVFYEGDQARNLSYAIGKTEHTIRSKMDQLRKRGLVEFYKNQYFQKLRDLT